MKPIESSLNFHLDDCLRWIRIWDDDLKRHTNYLKETSSNEMKKTYKEDIRFIKRSRLIIEKELYFVLAECLWYWRGVKCLQ